MIWICGFQIERTCKYISQERHVYINRWNCEKLAHFHRTSCMTSLLSYICLYIPYMVPGRFTPFVVHPRTVHPFVQIFFSLLGWITPLAVSPPDVLPPDVSPPGRFIPRNVHPPKCSPPEMFTPSEYFSFAWRIKIMYKTNQISV